MADYLNQLRKKPKHVRDNISFGVATGFSGVLALTWFFFGGFSSPAAVEISTTETEDAPAFSTLLNQVKEQMATVKEGFPDTATSSAANSGVVGGGATSTAPTANESRRVPTEAAIMVVPSASSTELRATSSVVY